MPKVTFYVNEDYIKKWKAVENKSALVYKALDTISEGEQMPANTILVKKVTDKLSQKGQTT